MTLRHQTNYLLLGVDEEVISVVKGAFYQNPKAVAIKKAEARGDVYLVVPEGYPEYIVWERPCPDMDECDLTIPL